MLEIVEGYRRSSARLPLAIVGSAPYAAAYTEQIQRIADGDDRIHLLGGVWDQELLDALYFHALTYVHGDSVGGTNPSLLRAIGAGTGVIAYDVTFNREILGERGSYFSGASEVARAVVEAEASTEVVAENGALLQALAESEFDWDRVAEGYEQLALRLKSGYSVHDQARRAHRARPQDRGRAVDGSSSDRPR